MLPQYGCFVEQYYITKQLKLPLIVLNFIFIFSLKLALPPAKSTYFCTNSVFLVWNRLLSTLKQSEALNDFKTKIKRLRNVKLMTKTLVWMIRVFEFRIFGFLTFFFIDSGSKEKLRLISDKPYVFLIQYLVANNLVCFTTRVTDTSDTSEVQTKQVQHEWDASETSDTSAKRTTRVQHDWKILILITTRVKTYF